MSQPPKPRGLGRGLSALLGDEEVAATVTPSSEIRGPSRFEPPPPRLDLTVRPPARLSIGQLRPGKFQPRTVFDNLDVLVESVREHGLLQPILVRPVLDQANVYEIVAGERRWRAAQQAQLHEVPVVIRNLGPVEALQLGLVENLQRVDLSPIDEAAGYRRLLDEFHQTQEDVAKTVGKSRPHVANLLRLLELPPAVQEMIGQQKISAGQARALLAFPDPAAMAQRTIDDKLTVRDLEQLAKTPSAAAPGPKGKAATATATAGDGKTADTRVLEKRIEEALGLKANLILRGIGEQTMLTLEIRDYDQLDAVIDRLTRR